jgi:hypothetical protein
MLSRRRLLSAAVPTALALPEGSRLLGDPQLRIRSTSQSVDLSTTIDLPSQAVVLDPDSLDTLAVAVQQTLAGTVPGVPSRTPAWPGQRLGPVYVALRRDGERVASAWGDGATALLATMTAVREAMAGQDSDALRQVTTAELCLSHAYQAIDPSGEGQRFLSNVHRGVLGVEIAYAGENGRYSPTLMLANNWSFDTTLQRFADANTVSVEVLLQDADIRVFSGHQVLVTIGDPPRAVEMERGNRLVTMEDVTQPRVQELQRLMGEWLTGAVHPDGRMTYKYWPSRGEESTSNNMIRQWMATVALNRLAAARGGDADLHDLAARNIRYNLATFYRDDGDLGLIQYDGEVKLGAVALAALALIEHPHRAEFSHEEVALRRTVDALWQDDGSFRTFYLPPERNDNQNFYPGEALVLWASLYAESRDPTLLDRFMTSFRYYREWHLDPANRNPAFIPWHTQAYYKVWTLTGDPALREFMFEMNDWLLGMQEWESAVYPDTMGRFYDQSRPQYGPPHASSTGVYLEGLGDAYRLAVAVGDSGRADSYRLAIVRGLRSVMQLQFVDEIDLYYIFRQDLVRGGMRTTVYDNEIRVDNVQHNLLAVLNILDAFRGADFTTRS